MNLNENCLIKQLTDNTYSLDELIPDADMREYFKSMYLMALNNYKCYGYFVGNELKALVSFYKSINEASWYLTHVFYTDSSTVPALLSYCISLNESEGTYKFYNLVGSDNVEDSYWAASDKERYIQVDECKLLPKTKSFYLSYWMILQERILLEKEYTVRCNFLKQEHRDTIPIGGNI